MVEGFYVDFYDIVFTEKAFQFFDKIYVQITKP